MDKHHILQKKAIQMKKKILIVVFWLLVWHLLALWVDNKILLVTPVRAILSLCNLIVTKPFWLTVAGSFVRIGAGFLLGLITACILAALASRWKWIEALLEPVMALLKAVQEKSRKIEMEIFEDEHIIIKSLCRKS